MARQAFGRTLAERRAAAAQGAVGIHAEYGKVVRSRRGARRRGFLAAPRKRLYMFAAPGHRPSRALRLAVQDAALSRLKHGFDSRRARHRDQRWSSTEVFPPPIGVQ